MKYDFSFLSVNAVGEAAEYARELFSEEIELRAGYKPFEGGEPCVDLVSDSSVGDKDTYIIEQDGSHIKITAQGIRGLIFGYSYFLRKCVFSSNKITLIRNIDGVYTPDKKIRGHQCGYRTIPNTYDAWGPDEYFRFYRDIMAFGCNTCEHIPGGDKDEKNPLMKYHPLELAAKASEYADKLDMDVSCWYPNKDEEDEETALAKRRKVFETMPRINAIFPPGGDPGEMDGDDFVKRCIAISKVLKSVKPNAEMWPSAQAPHSNITWPEDFMGEMEKLPDEITGVITGPNHAFLMDDLRRKLPAKYPIRFYPDITHNVRCEYPVHFDRDDWHYALASTLSRESINPRPTEYRLLHRLTRPYVVGSVSYSEGVNDDVNKAVWSDMDFFPDVSLYDTLCDYARFFIWQADAKKIADAILGLERNWEGDPAENPHIEHTLQIIESELEKAPALINNWRFVMMLFRAKCDMLVRRRRQFELELINEARCFAAKGDFESARKELMTDYDGEYYALRASLGELADKLFEQIGMQLDVENYHASGWERGATLDTIDLPVTDRAWLLGRYEAADSMPEGEREAFLERVFNRNKIGKGEYYYSFAEYGFGVLGERQKGEFYMDYQGDRPEVNNGSIPMCMLKAFDNYTFVCKLAGFEPDTDYKLRITYKKNKYDMFDSFYIKANGTDIYRGKFFGGEKDEQFESEMLNDRFTCAVYDLPASVFENGCVALEIGEEHVGVVLSEFKIYKGE
ncbi:MAG: hypothetical protein IJA87_00660 [Clostridia bacterium]|nr:hypothetical protein [Clostridia bacterium]